MGIREKKKERIWEKREGERREKEEEKVREKPGLVGRPEPRLGKGSLSPQERQGGGRSTTAM